MKNSISKIIIVLIILIVGIGASIGYNYIAKKEKGMHYKFEDNKLLISIYSDEWKAIGSDIIEENTNADRIFDKEPTVAVSNSNTEPGTCVYKAFDVLDTEELHIDEFTVSNGLCFKKIVSYDEYLKYKNMWSGIRELTKEDFSNYYLILIIDKNPNENETYTFKRLLVEDEYLNLNITKRGKNISEKQASIATGVAIIIPNRTDFDEDKINIVLDK